MYLGVAKITMQLIGLNIYQLELFIASSTVFSLAFATVTFRNRNVAPFALV